MSVLFKQHYYWIDSAASGADQYFCRQFKHVLDDHRNKTLTLCRRKPQNLVFLCIGTPLIAGDSLGPRIGSALANQGINNVYGTMDAPVHAENIEFYRKFINHIYYKPTIIAIDAAIGNASQEGFITVRKGSLKPGSGLGKKIPPIGDIEITGIFEDIEKKSCLCLARNLSRIISKGIINFIFNSLF